MSRYPNLPCFVINAVDGGLAARRPPTAKSTLVFGTAAQGAADSPYQVTDRARAAQEFGFQGNLVRAMEEVSAQGSDNIILFRMGTKPAVLKAVGKDNAVGAVTPGFDIEFGQRSATTKTDYKLFYKTGLLAVWFQETLVFSNDPLASVDTGDVAITGTITGNTGLELGTGTVAVLSAAITLQAAAALTGTSSTPTPVLTDVVTGLGLSARQTYIALCQARDLVDGMQVDQMVCPAATVDALNVAFYVQSDQTTAANNPGTNADALDWLKSTDDGVGNKTYQWASEAVDSNGTVVPVMSAVTAADRILAGFYEVNFGHLLASMAANISGINNTCLAFLGASAPRTYKLADVRQWVGAPTVTDASSKPTTAGRGLLGIAYLNGTTASKLNALCSDFSSGARLPGFFDTEENAYDGTVLFDPNQNPIDIGAYLHVMADEAILSNAWRNGYAASAAASVAGRTSVLDEKSSLLNKARC